MKKQKYLPPYKETKMSKKFLRDDENVFWLGFLKKILKGEKKLLRQMEVMHSEVPRYPEVTLI
jgi:hypothetical protein